MKKHILPIISLISCLGGNFGAYAMDRPIGHSVTDSTGSSLAKHKSTYKDPFAAPEPESKIIATPTAKRFVPHYLVAGDGTNVPFDPEILKGQSKFIAAALRFRSEFEKKQQSITLHPKLFPTKHTVKIIVKILYTLAGYAWQKNGSGKKLSGELEGLEKAHALLQKLPKCEISQQADYLIAANLDEELVLAYILAKHRYKKKPELTYTLADYWVIQWLSKKRKIVSSLELRLRKNGSKKV